MTPEAITLKEHCSRIGKLGTGWRKMRGDAEYYRKLAKDRWKAEKKKKAQEVKLQ